MSDHTCFLTHTLQDPLSLVPWMRTLFAMADAGMTTFDVSGPFYPHTNLRALFGPNSGTSYFEGSEAVLGHFKRRWVFSALCMPD